MMQYIGQTLNSVNKRYTGHRSGINTGNLNLLAKILLKYISPPGPKIYNIINDYFGEYIPSNIGMAYFRPWSDFCLVQTSYFKRLGDQKS